MNKKNKEQDKQSSKNATWLRNFAIGLVLFISGILAKFFPSTILTVGYIVAGVIFALIGINDIIAALKYKQTGADSKLILIMGVVSLITAVYFIPAVIYLYSAVVSLYVIFVWLITRGILDIYGRYKGSLKRKNVILWAIVMIASGTTGAIFCKQIVAYSISYLPYILLATGTIMAFFGIYQKTDEKESKEKALREEEIQKGLPEAIETARNHPEMLSDAIEEAPLDTDSANTVDTAADSVTLEVTEPQNTDSEQALSEEEVEIVETTPKAETEGTKKKGFFKSLLDK